MLVIIKIYQVFLATLTTYPTFSLQKQQQPTRNPEGILK